LSSGAGLTDEQLDRMLDRSALSAPNEGAKTDLKWKHEYVGPSKAKKAKREAMEKNKKSTDAKAAAPKNDDVFEVLVDCAPDDGIDL
jgi:hypothetical protein